MEATHFHQARRSTCALFASGIGFVATIAGAWAADDPLPPDPSAAPIPVVADVAAAQAVLKKALASGQALVSDLQVSEKGDPTRCKIVCAKPAEPLAPGRYRPHALVATTPQNDLISEAVVMFLWFRGSYRNFEPAEYFPEPGKLAPVHYDFTLDKPNDLPVEISWLVGDSKLNPDDGQAARGKYLAKRKNFMLQSKLKPPTLKLDDQATDAAADRWWRSAPIRSPSSPAPPAARRRICGISPRHRRR